jgi:hypothetical protein
MTPEQLLRKKIAGLRCVKAGWAFGVPEDGQEQWLDEVVAAVYEIAPDGVWFDREQTGGPWQSG